MPNTDIARKCITGYRSENGKEWVCATCKISIKEDRIPKLSIANGMGFPPKPAELNLCPLEERLISLRIPFMQIYELPRGRQYSVKGNVVNVPMDISHVVETLPRYIDRADTIPVKLKRKIAYTSSVYTQNVRPREVLNALLYLKNNTPLYSDVNVDENWLQDVLQNGLCLDRLQNADAEVELGPECNPLPLRDSVNAVDQISTADTETGTNNSNSSSNDICNEQERDGDCNDVVANDQIDDGDVDEIAAGAADTMLDAYALDPNHVLFPLVL